MAIFSNDFNFFGGEGGGKVPPIPGGFGNPTGANRGGITARGGGQKQVGFAGNFDFPLFGQPDTSGSNMFPANMGGFGGTQIQGLNIGGNLYDPQGQYHLGKQMRDIFGESTGNLIASFLSGGAGYNPQVAQALINQMQPLEARGMANIEEMFGASGGRFSSESALAAGDFQSQFALNEQGVLANLYNDSVNRYMETLLGIAPAAQAENANKGGISDILSGILGIGGSLLGGPLGGILGGAVGGGIGSLFGGGGGGATSMSGGSFMDMLGGFGDSSSMSSGDFLQMLSGG